MNFTNNQLDAITKSGTNIIVSAGAGSGKTAVLTERVTRKLDTTSINRLLILTFTNAAAAEMKDRIRKKLIERNLTKSLDEIDSSYITTFDSFALSIVKKYHARLGIPNTIGIMDNSIIIVKSNEVLDEIFENKYDDYKFRKLINDFCVKDDKSIKEIFKKMSSKLDLLSNKDQYLDNYIETHYSDSYIDAKINEYYNEVIRLKESIKPIYNELCLRVDQTYLDKFNIYDLLESTTYDEIKISLLKVGSPRKNKECADDFKIYKDKISKIIKKINDLTVYENSLEIKENILKTKDYVEVIIDIKKEFDKKMLEIKKKINLYTFNDIALMAIKVVKENEDIRVSLRDSFDEIMIDEYQDTSDIQEEFIGLISNNNVYMVGDIKQSIYRFRNANPYIFKDKYIKYGNNDNGIKIDLLENFRSRKEVLNNINLIFNLIMDLEIGDADYPKSHQMVYGNKSYDTKFGTNQNYDMDILIYTKSDDYSKEEIEAFIIANDIKNKIENKFQVAGKDSLRDATYSDFSIIMDRESSFDLYKKIFEYLNIPITPIKNEVLTNGYDIMIISNLIKLIIKLHTSSFDNETKYLFVSVSRSYLFNTNDEEIFDNINKIYETELYKKCKSIDIFELSNHDLLDKIIDEFDIYNKLLTINNINDVIIKLDYLKKLSLSLSDVGYSIIEFSNYLSEMLEEGAITYSNSSSSNSVKILNIHKSKGLEYSVCYFAGLNKEFNKDDLKSKFIVDSNYNIITPFIGDGIEETIYKDLLISEENRKNLSERIRLFYVALTRTKEKMIIVSPIDYEVEGYTSLVPTNVRLSYNKLSDILDSINKVLDPYIKEVDLDSINLTKEYDKNIKYNYSKSNTNEKIELRENNIEYNLLEESRYSKHVNKLISKEEYDNINLGTEIHKIFELEDFNTTTNKYVLSFLNKIDKNYINIYKEYEFIYVYDNQIRNGIIDLILEYNDHIKIIDYKLKNIKDDNYLKQLNGYKEYIKSISNKEVYIYLYSILDDTLEEIK